MSYLKLKVKDVEYFECTDINNNKSQIIAKCVFKISRLIMIFFL